MKQSLHLIIMVLFMFAGLTGFSQTPVAYYSFSGNANDAGSNGLNGTILGNPVLTEDNQGIANSAYSFDGVGDHIDLGSTALLKPTTAVSVCLWAYSSNWASFDDWAALASNTQSGGYELIVNGQDGVVESEVKRNGSYGVASYPLTSLSAGWHHFAFSFNGQYNILYVDASSVDADDAGDVYPIQYGTPNNHTLIGAEGGSVGTEGDYFTGKIDEVRFYDIALTSLQIQQIYNSSLWVKDIYSDINTIQLFPNPAVNSLNISGIETLKNYYVEIYDVCGRSQMKLFNKSFISIEPLPAGIYFLYIRQGNSTYSRKFIKQ